MRKKEFLGRVEAFLTSQGLSATRFGINACHDPAFVFRLRRGMETREEKKERVLAYMENFPNARVKTNSRDWAAGDGTGDWTAGDGTGVEGPAGNGAPEDQMAVGPVIDTLRAGDGSVSHRVVVGRTMNTQVADDKSGSVWTGVNQFACDEAAEHKINAVVVKNAPSGGVWTGANQFVCDGAAKVISFPGVGSVTDHALTKESGATDE